MKIVLTISFFLLSYTNQKKENLYWENLNEKEKNEILMSNDISDLALNYYLGKLRINQEEKIIELIELICNDKIHSKYEALYFHLFNKICLDSDGSISEILGNYCQLMVLKNPEFTINYFDKNLKVMEKYAFFIGSEFSYEDENLSLLKYNYQEFRRILKNRKVKDYSYYKKLNSFLNIIEKNIKSLD